MTFWLPEKGTPTDMIVCGNRGYVCNVYSSSGVNVGALSFPVFTSIAVVSIVMPKKTGVFL